jgi:hypothetical protein
MLQEKPESKMARSIRGMICAELSPQSKTRYREALFISQSMTSSGRLGRAQAR